MKERGVRRRELGPLKRMAKIWRNGDNEMLQLTALLLDHYVKGGTFDTWDTPDRFYVLLNEESGKR